MLPDITPRSFNLLDFLTRPSVGPMPDVTPQTMAPPQRRGGGLLDALNQTFGGTKESRMQAGLMGLIAANQPGANLMQTLATGALTGQQYAQQQRAMEEQEALQRQRMEALQQAVGDGEIGPDQLRKLFTQAVVSGDTESAKAIATVVQAVESSSRPRATGTQRRVTLRDPETGRPTEYLVDDQGNKIMLGEAVTAGGSRSTLQSPREVVINGETVLASFDPATGRMVPVQGASPVPRAASGGSEAERKAAAFAGFIPEAVDYVDSIASAPGRVEQALSDKGLREFTDAEQQQLQLSGSALAEAWLRMTTGAAYNEREFQNAYNLFVPRPGDRQETLEMKKRNRRRLVDMLKTSAGRAGIAPSGPEQPDPFADLIPGGPGGS